MEAQSIDGDWGTCERLLTVNDRGIHPRTAADATGLESPVIELVRKELRDLRFDLSEVTITSGCRVAPSQWKEDLYSFVWN